MKKGNRIKIDESSGDEKVARLNKMKKKMKKTLTLEIENEL
jgi:hypothetical protein